MTRMTTKDQFYKHILNILTKTLCHAKLKRCLVLWGLRRADMFAAQFPLLDKMHLAIFLNCFHTIQKNLVRTGL